MTNNDIIRRLRYTLGFGNKDVIEMFRLVQVDMDYDTLDRLLKKEEEEGYVECNAKVMELFLDGLIILKRGPRDSSKPAPKKSNEEQAAFNNVILRKIRIALEFKDGDMLECLRLGNFPISKSELSALFRKPSHRNYMDCQEQLLRKFLSGLNKYLNGDTAEDFDEENED